MNKFFDFRYNHIEDGLVEIHNQTLAPFEAVFRFIKGCDKNLKEGTKLRLYLISDLEGTLPEADEKTISLIWHCTNGEFPEDKIKELTKDMTPVAVMNKFFEAMHYTALVARKDNETHIYYKGSLMSQSNIIVKAAFAFKQLFPTAFEGKLTDWAPEFKEALIAVDKNNLDKAWDIIEPYYLEIKKNQWQIDLKNMFVNTYADQIKAEEQRKESDYAQIENLEKQISEYLKRIEDRNIRIRGLLASNHSEQNYVEFVEYLKTIKAEIVDFADGGSYFTIRFRGYADNYDPVTAADIIPSLRGYLYSSVPEEEKETLRKVYTKVFIDEEYKMMITSNTKVMPHDYQFVHVDPNPGTAASIDGIDYLQNPHIKHHDCYGNNRGDIRESLQRYDYYALAMMLNASNSNLSFGDPTVAEELSKDILKNRKKKIFFCPGDGKYYSYDDLAKEVEDNGTDESGSEASE